MALEKRKRGHSQSVKSSASNSNLANEKKEPIYTLSRQYEVYWGKNIYQNIKDSLQDLELAIEA